MRFFKIISVVSGFIACTVISAQLPVIQVLESGRKTSLRGLSVVSDNIVWASGSNGTVTRSLDGGKTFEWISVPGYEKRDFRDIEAFDANTAIIMAVAEPAVLLKTKDGGKSWKKVFEDSTKGMFLDAMDFTREKGARKGMVIGDPLDNRIFFAVTEDDGDSWQTATAGAMMQSPAAKALTVATGEAMFAASGTNLKIVDFGKDFYTAILVVTGGTKSSLRDIFKRQTADSLPVIQGRESTGANSIAVNTVTKKGVIVGGDFANDTLRSGNCVLVSFEPKQFRYTRPQTPPHGYRSCVIYTTANKLVACGTSGIDVSVDGGMNWQLISRESFHVVQKAKQGTAIFMAGGNGRIARLTQF